MKLAVIGYGPIVRLALRTLAERIDAPLDAVIVYAKPDGLERARAMLDAIGARLAREFIVTANIDNVIAARPAFAVEAAGHAALHQIGASLLTSGVDLVVTSVGAMADDALRAKIESGAQCGASAWTTIPGAIGGLDILAAAKLSGLTRVTYTGRKPPRAWKGTKAETLLDLNTIATEQTFFDGSAGVAARDYPQNANVAATLALAGAGFEATRVRLVADPAITRNVHEISVESACADFTFRVEGRAAPDNPKTSLTVAYSLASAILLRIPAR